MDSVCQGKMRRMEVVMCVMGDGGSGRPSKALMGLGLASLNTGIDSEESIDWQMKLPAAQESRRRETDTYANQLQPGRKK